MPAPIYDCIVVGAGPAGGSAAYHLARRGFSVLLLEREKLPRYKPCGGFVIDRVADWFDFDFTPAISVKVSRLIMVNDRPGGFSGELYLPRAVWMVHREVFDNYLVRQACSRGAALREQFEVTGLVRETGGWQVLSGERSERCRYLIAADGAKGMMAFLLGFKDRIKISAGALEVELPAPDTPEPAIHLHFPTYLNGYSWNFAKHRSHSVGVGSFGRTRHSLRAELDACRGRFGLGAAGGKVFGHPLLLWDGAQPLHTDRALLAGEAACWVDPLNGEGIRPAMMSGVAAADAVANALNGSNDALAGYSRVMCEGYGREMELARSMAAAFYSPGHSGVTNRMRSAPALELSARLTCGDITYRKFMMGHAFLSALKAA